MNTRTVRCMRMLALSACALGAGSVAAADLTVRFTGRFQPGTCAFSVTDADLGSYQASTFTGSTSTGWRRLTITRSACTSDITVVHLRANGTASADNSQYFAARTASGSLTGIAIELGNLSNQRMVPNSTAFDWAAGAGTATYQLQARFVQTRAGVSAGQVRTPITLQFTYN